MGVYEYRGFVHSRRTTGGSRKTDRQLCAGIYWPSDSPQQLLASSFSFYLHMYICTLSEPQVSEAPHVPLRTRHQSASTSEPSKSKKQTLVTNSAAFA